jgi:hypothetical protein
MPINRFDRFGEGGHLHDAKSQILKEVDSSVFYLFGDT